MKAKLVLRYILLSFGYILLSFGIFGSILTAFEYISGLLAPPTGHLLGALGAGFAWLFYAGFSIFIIPGSILISKHKSIIKTIIGIIIILLGIIPQAISQAIFVEQNLPYSGLAIETPGSITPRSIIEIQRSSEPAIKNLLFLILFVFYAFYLIIVITWSILIRKHKLIKKIIIGMIIILLGIIPQAVTYGVIGVTTGATPVEDLPLFIIFSLTPFVLYMIPGLLLIM